MKAKFEMKVPPGKTEAIEYIEISGHEPKDVMHRAATQADRERYPSAYAEFKGGAVAPVESASALTQAEPPAEAKPEAKPESDGFFRSSKGKK